METISQAEFLETIQKNNDSRSLYELASILGIKENAMYKKLIGKLNSV